MDLILEINVLFYVTLLLLVQGNAHGGIKSKTDSFNCSLSSNSATAKDVQRYLQEDKHVIRVNLTIDGQSSSLENNNTSGLLNVNKWTFAKDEQGTSLLLLDEQFELMSLYTLSSSVSEINALVQQYPENCLGNLTEGEMETAIRLHFLNLIDYTKDSNEDVQICNKHFYEVGNSEAEIIYECCSKMFNEQLNCKKEQPGKWYKIFKLCTYILIVIAWGFSVNIIPTTFSEKSKRVVLPYQTEMESMPSTSNFNVNTNTHETERSPLLQSSEHISDTRYNLNYCTSRKMCLDIDINKLSSPNRATAGFCKWLWNSFVMCDIKDYNEDTKICCSQNMFCNNCQEAFVWYRCLRCIAHLTTIFILTSPLLFRFCVYFKTEPYRHDRIDERNLSLKVRWYNDLHNYNVFIYYFFPFEIIMYILLIPIIMLPGEHTIILKTLVLECKEKENRLGEIISQCFRCLILRCKLQVKNCKCDEEQCIGVDKCERKSKRFSICHAFLLPFSLILTLVYFCLVVFPTSRFIGNVVCKMKECSERTEVISLIFLEVVFIYSVIMFVDSISFLVQCAVYFMAGIIFNYDANLKYFGSFIFICLYGHEVITNANDTFETFKDTILKSIQACHTNLKSIKTNAKHNDMFYNGFIGSQSKFTTENKGNKKKLCCQGGFVFYTESHGKYIPVVSDRFLNELASLKVHPSCPGSLSVLYIQAIGKIMSRTLLLVFVLFTVLALTNELSDSIKTLFALLSGYIVTNFRKFWSSSKKRSDDDSQFWQNKLMIREDADYHFLTNFEECWTLCSEGRWFEYNTEIKL